MWSVVPAVRDNNERQWRPDLDEFLVRTHFSVETKELFPAHECLSALIAALQILTPWERELQPLLCIRSTQPLRSVQEPLTVQELHRRDAARQRLQKTK